MDTVEYRDIAGFPGYRVGNDGSVWYCWITCRWGRRMTDRWKPMRQAFAKHRTPGRQHRYVNLTPPEGGKYRTFRVHRLVLEAFVGPCPDGHECRHLDGDPSNNRLDNLCWGSRQENADDSRRMDRYRKGEKHPQVKLTADDVRSIRAKYATGNFRMIDLADEFHVTFTNIHAIVRRRSWKHIN